MKHKIPKYAIAPLCVCLVSQFATYYLPMLLNVTGRHLLSSALDSKIPVVPVFAFVYVSAIIMWIVMYTMICCRGKQLAWRFTCADLLCKVVCNLCFYLYPCTIERPETVSGLCAWALETLYACDEPINLLPSMHCYMSWLCVRPFLDNLMKQKSLALKLALAAYVLAICLSTLFTKQHVIIDVVTGLALAETIWRISSKFRRHSNGI